MSCFSGGIVHGFSRVSLAFLVFLLGPACSRQEPKPEEEIEVNAQAQTLDVGLLGNWRLDDGTLGVAADSSTNANPATFTNPAWATGKIGGAASLGTGSFMRVPPSASIDSATAALSFAGWIYRTAAPSADEYIFYRRNATLGTVAHLLQGPSGVVCFSINGNQSCTGVLSFGAWHHVAGTWDGATKKIYVDGVLASTSSTSGTLAYSQSYSLYLGSNQGGALNWRGQLDELRMYGRALTALEVSSLSNPNQPNPFPAGQALFVVGNTTLSPSDAAVKARLIGLGFQALVVQDSVSQTSDATGKSLVVVSESVSSGNVLAKFKTVTVPAIFLEPSCFDDMAMAPVFTQWNTVIGDIASQTTLNLVGTHPLAAGFSGSIVVANPSEKFVWAKPTSSQVTIAAHIAGDPTKAAIFGYDIGALMENAYAAPHRRVGFFAGSNTPANLTADGWTLFDSAVRWATQARARLVVASGTLSAADTVLKSRIEALGYSVTVTPGPATTTTDGAGMGLIVISESVSSADVNTKYTSIPVSIVTLEPALQDELGMTGGVWMTDQGDALAQTTLRITNPSNPLAAGLSGDVLVTSSPQKFVWGKPNANGAVSAVLASDPTRAAIYSYPSGAVMVNGTAPAARTFLFSGSPAASSFTTAAGALFDATVLPKGPPGDPGIGLLGPVVLPREPCVIPGGGGTFDAVFTYGNGSAVNQNIPIGSQNTFSPTPAERGQPQWFKPGIHGFVIRGLSGIHSWRLGSLSVQASSTSTPCQVQPNSNKELTVIVPGGVLVSAGLDLNAVTNDSVLPTDQQSMTTVGNTSGGLSVSHDGVAGYSIPLEVPAGHVRPSLSLAYNHRAGSGTVGVGWNLEGLSQIRRCPRVLLFDGNVGRIEFGAIGEGAAATQICLDGNRLLPIPDGTLPTKKFKLENDSRILVEVAEFEGNIPRRFVLRDGEGRIMTFGGNSDDSLLEGPVVHIETKPGLVSYPSPTFETNNTSYPSSGRLAWSLSRVEDAYGNAFTVQYSKVVRTSDNAVEQVPTIIFYERPNQPALRVVQFVYENRPDPIVQFVSGLKTIISQRMSRVIMVAPLPQFQGVFKTYELSYAGAPTITGRSLLRSVRECDGLGVCKQPLSFEYEPGNFNFSELPTGISEIPTGTFVTNVSDTSHTAIHITDLNGDGFDDILYRKAAYEFGGQQNYVERWYRATSTGNGFGPSIATNLPTEDIRAGTRSSMVSVDLDGDGIKEVGISDEQYDGSPAPRFYRMDPSSGNFVAVTDGLSLFSGDLNGDGLSDMIVRDTSDPNGWRIKLNNSASPGQFVTFASGVFTIPDINNSYFIDNDGNGVLDFMFKSSDHSQYVRARPFISESQRTNLFPSIRTLSGFRYVFLDVNGDDLSDAFEMKNAPWALFPVSGIARRLLINSGDGFIRSNFQDDSGGFPFLASAVAEGSAVRMIDPGVRVADIDQDGQQDLLVLSKDLAGNKTFWIKGSHDGTLSYNELSGIGATTPTVDGLDMNQVLDVNGDGLTDFIQNFEGTLRLYQREQKKADLLVRVTDSFGARTEVVYAPLVSPGVHTPSDRASAHCQYPLSCLRRGAWVAKEIKRDNGVNDQLNRETHRYVGAKVHLRGRGWLGVEQHIVEDVRTGAETLFDFDNYSLLPGTEFADYPFRGKAKRVRTRVRTNSNVNFARKLTSERLVNYDSIGLPGNLVMPKTICQSQYESAAWDIDPLPSNLLAQACTNLEYDQFVNITSQNTTFLNGEIARRETTYKSLVTSPPTAPRLLGVPTRVVNTSTVPARNGFPVRLGSRVQNFISDASGGITQVVVEPDVSNDPGTGAPLQLTTTYGRNARGQVVTVTQTGVSNAPAPLGSVETPYTQTRTWALTYDDLDGVFPTSVTDPVGHTIRFAYHPGLGVKIAEEDENGTSTFWRYDGFGRVRQISRSGSGTVNVHYDATSLGSMAIHQVQSGGADTTMVLDRLGREILTSGRAFRGRERIAKTVFDLDGRVAFASLPRFSVFTDPDRFVSFAYDPAGRVTEEVAADGAVTSYLYEGRVVARTDAKVQVQGVLLDELGRTAQTAAGGLTTAFDYGPFGQLAKVTNPGGFATTISYDKQGRRAGLIDPDSGNSAFVSNAFGELVHRKDGSNRLESSKFDVLGRTVLMTNPDGETVFDYDRAPSGIGSLSSSMSPDGVRSEHRYDILGREIAVQVTMGQSHETFDIAKSFDSFGRLQDLSYPEPGMGEARLRVRYDYSTQSPTDLLKITNQSTGSLIWKAEDRNAFGNVTQEFFGNAVRVARGFKPNTGLLSSLRAGQNQGGADFDPDNLGQSMPDAVNLGGLIQNLSYEYDANRNLHQRTDGRLGREDFFVHDPLNRLQTWTSSGNGGSAQINYGYDAIGNLHSRTGGPNPSNIFEHAMTSGAGPHALTTMSEVGSYSYGTRGEQLSAPGRSVTYNNFDLPKEIGITGIQTVGFEYDAFQQRVSKRSTGAETIYVGPHYERRTDSSGRKHVFHIFGEGRRLAQVVWAVGTNGLIGNRSTEYLHSDELGSAETVTGTDGGVVGRMRFEPFGRQVDPSAPWQEMNAMPGNVRHGFTGHEFDQETGLINAKGRIYDGKNGHFLSADPVVQAPAWASSYNRYAYAFNNPVTLVDPSGFQSCFGVECGAYSGGWSGGGGGGGPSGSSAPYMIGHPDPEPASGSAPGSFAGNGRGPRGPEAPPAPAARPQPVARSSFSDDNGTRAGSEHEGASGSGMDWLGSFLDQIPGWGSANQVGWNFLQGNYGMAAAFFGAGVLEMVMAVPVAMEKATISAARILAEEAVAVTRALVRGPGARATFRGLEVRGMRDLSHVPESTLRAMADKGFAATDANGRALILHHHRQNPAGFIVEMPASKHSIGNPLQHPFGNTPGAGLSGAQRAAFDGWRVDYWKARASGELSRRGL